MPEEIDLSPEERSKIAAALGRIGGKKGGKARAAKLSQERRKEIATQAANARWQHKAEA